MTSLNIRHCWRTAAALSAVLALGVSAGCSGGADSQAGGKGTAAPVTVYGTLGTTIQAEFNPFQMATGQATGGTALLYLPLESYDRLTGKYTPYLATGFRVVSATETDFTLRDGVKWSNGSPVTAQDVVFSYELIKKDPALDTAGIWQSLSSVTARGNTIVFTTKAPDSQIPPDLAQVPVVPQSLWSKIQNPTAFANASPSVVDGPYTLGSTSTVKVTFKKNPGYFAAAARSHAPDTVIALPVSPGPNQVLAMENGTFDWSLTSDSDRGGFQKDWVAKDPTHNRYWLAPGGPITLYLNLTRAPFNDTAFRQALSYGIDRNQLALKANLNNYEPAVAQTGLPPNRNDLLPASIPNHGMIAVDQAKARQIFTSNGYHYDGNRLIGKNGKQVSFTLQTVQGYVDWLGIAQGLVSQLGALGIAVTLTQVQANSALSNLSNGQYDTAVYAFGTSPTLYANYNTLLNSAMTAPIGKPATGNYERLNDPSVDALLNQISSTTDVTRQDKALSQIAKYVYTQVPVLNLALEQGGSAYTTKRYTGWPSSANPVDVDSPWSYLSVIPNLKAASGG